MLRLALALGLALVLAPAQEKSLSGEIDALVRGLRLKDGRAGVLVRSARSGGDVYAHRERETFQMASNTKLLTTAAALCRLGPGFRFRTPVGMVGPDLHVFGGGDPNISGRFHGDDPTAVFRKWAEKLRTAGVDRIRHLVLHTGIFDEARLNPGWKGYDLWFWWAAPFGPVSLNDNCVDLTVEPAGKGQPCRVSLSPDTAYVSVVNRTEGIEATVRPVRPFGFTRAAGTNVITLRGEVGARGTHWVAVHDPTLYFGTVLRETLAKSGIAVTGALEESGLSLEETKGFRELAAWESDLASTIAVCNQPSQNFYAEMILRTLGWKEKGKGTLENGLAAVRDFLAREAGAERVSQADGSGLTRENLASPEDVVRLLLFMRSHRHAKEFLDSLPAGGMPKTTLRNRLAAADLKGRVRAKTGHIAGVAALSGYAESLSGDTYVFSILVNGDPGASTAAADRLQDRICELLVRHKGDGR